MVAMWVCKRFDFNNKGDGALHILDLDSGYLAVGGAEDSVGWPLKLAIVYLNESGNEIWKKQYGKKD